MHASPSGIAVHLLAFMEVAMHSLLCVRSVYPPVTFSKRRKFGQLVWWSDVVAVEAYISEALSSLAETLRKNLLRRFVLSIWDMSGTEKRIIEQFVFEFDLVNLARPDVRSSDDFLRSVRAALTKTQLLGLLVPENKENRCLDNQSFQFFAETVTADELRLLGIPTNREERAAALGAKGAAAVAQRTEDEKLAEARFKCKWIETQTVDSRIAAAPPILEKRIMLKTLKTVTGDAPTTIAVVPILQFYAEVAESVHRVGS
eukprot:Polyplicarium_translucidae@DN706_c0_g1_i1.p3